MLLLNGQYNTHITAHDRGLLYGDGLFETIAVSQGQPLLFQRHLQRLYVGCQRLGIEFNEAEQLQQECKQLLEHEDGTHIAQGILKIILTRGSGKRGYRPEKGLTATRIVSYTEHQPYPDHYRTEGVVVTFCQHHLSSNPALAGIKHLNRLDQVMASLELKQGVQEGLMFDQDENIIEGTMSNLFIIIDGMLVTPQVTSCGVAGIMRQLIIDCAHQNNMPLSIRKLNMIDINNAQEMFLCNSLIKIWPVRKINERHIAIGPRTQNMMAALDKHLEENLP